jgi:hypothetical protein
MKAQVNSGRQPEIYYFRDEQGLEVDFLLPRPNGSIMLIECKASQTVTPGQANPLRRFAATLIRKRQRSRVSPVIVHQETRLPAATRALAPGVQAVSWRDFVADL